MSKLRPECVASKKAALPDETALFLIKESVVRRYLLIHGRLDDGHGNHCAIGCFFADNPDLAITSGLLDEVAAVNDSIPPNFSPKVRWKKVNSWLRFKLRVLAHDGAASN